MKRGAVICTPSMSPPEKGSKDTVTKCRLAMAKASPMSPSGTRSSSFKNLAMAEESRLPGIFAQFYSAFSLRENMNALQFLDFEHVLPRKPARGTSGLLLSGIRPFQLEGKRKALLKFWICRIFGGRPATPDQVVAAIRLCRERPPARRGLPASAIC